MAYAGDLKSILGTLHQNAAHRRTAKIARFYRLFSQSFFAVPRIRTKHNERPTATQVPPRSCTRNREQVVFIPEYCSRTPRTRVDRRITKRTLGPLFRLQPGRVVAPWQCRMASREYLPRLMYDLCYTPPEEGYPRAFRRWESLFVAF